MASSSSSQTQPGDSFPFPALPSPTLDTAPSSASSSTNTDQPSPKRQKLSVRSVSEFITIILQPSTDDSDSDGTPEPEWTEEIPALKSIICSHSTYFARHCNQLDLSSQPSNSAPQKIHLIGHRQETLSIFLTYIYTSGDLSRAERLPEVTTKVCEDPHLRTEEYATRFRALLECHLLGHHIEAENFSNAIIDLLIKDVRAYYFEMKGILGLTAENIELVYKKYDNKLREVLIELALLTKNEDLHALFLDNESSPEMSAFQLDVQFQTRERFDALRRMNPWMGGLKSILQQDLCEYHVHAGEGRCGRVREREREFEVVMRDDGAHAHPNPSPRYVGW